MAGGPNIEGPGYGTSVDLSTGDVQRIMRHRFFDPDTHKAVPVGAVTVDLEPLLVKFVGGRPEQLLGLLSRIRRDPVLVGLADQIAAQVKP